MFITSESVSRGHPDKVADQISDALVDLFLENDKSSKIAIETLVTTNTVILAGEVNSSFKPSFEDIQSVVRSVIKEIGYEQDGFSWKNFNLTNLIHQQSSDINKAVIGGDDIIAAGDQGIMYGFASNETAEYMPLAYILSRRILEKTQEKINDKTLLGLLPDAKSQITLFYDENDKPFVDNVVFSHQHSANINLKQIKDMLIPIVKDVLQEENLIIDNENIRINRSGKFITGGPDGDTGLTGRKIIFDTYGGLVLHGGGAFSGKDPTKVDRSAAYMCRYIAKNIVGAGLANKCTVSVCYVIGKAKNLALNVDIDENASVDKATLLDYLNKNISFACGDIIDCLKLDRPIYFNSSMQGHFGHDDLNLPWEKLDLVDEFKRLKS